MPSIPASTDPTRAGAADGAPATEAVLRLSALTVAFDTPGGTVTAAREVTLAVARGECLGVVGEAGAGKSQLFLAVLGLLAGNGRTQGSARFRGSELLTLEPTMLDHVRGAGIGMVFQDPMSSLTPHLQVGEQIAEVMVRHRGLSRRQARKRALELLRRVQVADPERRLRQYPHQLSGGMRQRVMIAIALSGEPQLLIADEPTTALDVTVQAQILALLTELKRERGLALVLITHDPGVVAGTAHPVRAMRDRRKVETGAGGAAFPSPPVPYTREALRPAPGRGPRGGLRGRGFGCCGGGLTPFSRDLWGGWHRDGRGGELVPEPRGDRARLYTPAAHAAADPAALSQVRVGAELSSRYPHELS